jgi:glycine cleavage system H protein
VVDVNAALKTTPEAVNKDPHGSWMIVIRLSDAAEATGLLDAAAYQALVK